MYIVNKSLAIQSVEYDINPLKSSAWCLLMTLVQNPYFCMLAKQRTLSICSVVYNIDTHIYYTDHLSVIHSRLSSHCFLLDSISPVLKEKVRIGVKMHSISSIFPKQVKLVESGRRGQVYLFNQSLGCILLR